jgi:hypothetical protein
MFGIFTEYVLRDILRTSVPLHPGRCLRMQTGSRLTHCRHLSGRGREHVGKIHGSTVGLNPYPGELFSLPLSMPQGLPPREEVCPPESRQHPRGVGGRESPGEKSQGEVRNLRGMRQANRELEAGRHTKGTTSPEVNGRSAGQRCSHRRNKGYPDQHMRGLKSSRQIGRTPVLSPNDLVGTPIRSKRAR